MVEIGRSTDSKRGQAGKILEYFMGRLEHLQPLYRVDTVRFPVERKLCPLTCRNVAIRLLHFRGIFHAIYVRRTDIPI